MEKEVKRIEMELADALENMQMLQNNLTSKLFNKIKTNTLFTEDTNEDADEEWIPIKGYNIHIRVYTKIAFISEGAYEMALKDGYDVCIASLEYDANDQELQFSFNRNRLEEIIKDEVNRSRFVKSVIR